MTKADNTPSASFLAIDGLTKTYNKVTVVDRFALEVEEGEFVSLLGPSGCGKTTTLQMLGGFVDPSAGSIRLEGRDLIAAPPSKRGLGMVFQSYALFPHMTAAQNIAYGLEVRKVPRAERDERVRQALDLVGLGAYGDRYPRRMSGGQQQRVALARALVIRPRVLLLDEPLSNLDANLREEMQIELRRIQQTTGTTTILVTHDQTEAMALSDRIVLMRAGRIEQIGGPEAVYARPANSFVARFLGKTNLFPGTVGADGRSISIGSHVFAAPAAATPGATIVAVRPEKLGFGEGGIRGVVRNRVFQGTQWLVELDTEHGPAIVQRQNLGAVPPAIGEATGLVFEPDAVHLMAPEADK
ncbi:ABC transporter ATP-binding protein [Devosia sediminis]|uniref:ABC transporter ATP-binding protein n=1 Tax=Devosia sediminis TaxID=2798801 RepID=UPI002E28E34D|nr:ABC transporter ATP-binding protein [Devosia sediminis]